MMAVIATGRHRKREFEPDTASIRAGTWWDRRPHCRPLGASKPAPPPRFPGPRILSPRMPVAPDGPKPT